jgi:hypothetical protein
VTNSEETALQAVIQRLCSRFAGQAREVVEAAVRSAHAEFDGRPVRDFVPVLVERAASKRLTVLGDAAPPIALVAETP